MKLTRTPGTLLKQLKGSAKSEFLNLAVGFKTECKFIDSRAANARDILKAMMKAGGEPIGFIDDETKRLTIRALRERDTSQRARAAAQVAERMPAGEFISGSFTPEDPALLRGELDLTLPRGTPFVLPLFAWSTERYDGYPGEPDDVPIDTAVALGSGHPILTIDGQVVITDENKADYFVPTTVFDPLAVYPVPTDYGAVGAVSFQGVGIVSAPLTPDVHVIHLYEPLILRRH